MTGGLEEARRQMQKVLERHGEPKLSFSGMGKLQGFQQRSK